MRTLKVLGYIQKAAIIVGLAVGTVFNARAAGTASNIAVSSGSGQTALVGVTLPAPFKALVTDSKGNAVSGAVITWTISSGNGSLASRSTTTNSSGLASDTLTLGTLTGNNKVVASTATGGNAVFGSEGTPGTAVSIGLSSGNAQTGTVGAPLANSLAVLCLDAYGNNSNSAQIDWTAGSGGDSFVYAFSSTSGGIATRPVTLGTVPGINTATATIKGTSLSYTFTETGVPGPVTAVLIVSGNDQVGSAAGALSNPFKVKVTDSYGNPVEGTQIDWTASTGGDSFSLASAITSASGNASSTLTLDKTFGLHNATANVDGTAIQQAFVATEGVDAVVAVQYSSSPQYVPADFMGLSYQKTYLSEPFFGDQNLPAVALFNKIGPGVLRIVAERAGTPIIWNPTGPGGVNGTVSTADLTRVAAFVKAVNWKILYGIALEKNTPAQAASEAEAVAKAFGSSLLGFEIGNEPDNYARAVYGTPPVAQVPNYTFQDYISTTPVYSSSGALLPSWPAFASAILAAVPNAPLTGPTGSFPTAIDFAASDQAPYVSLLTRHYYRLPTPAGSTPTMAELLVPDPTVPVQFPELFQAAASANIPGYRISECNSVAGGVGIPGVTNGFGAALWTIDFIFDNAVYQSTGVNFNGGGNVQSAMYSPIFDNGTSVTGIGPDYYGMFAAYSLLNPGAELLTTQVTPSPSTFSAYAVQQTNGTTEMILSNKDFNNSITVSVARPGSSSVANSLLMTAPSLTSTTGFELGGSPIQIDGSWEATSNPALPMVGNVAVVTIPPGSAQIVEMQ